MKIAVYSLVYWDDKASADRTAQEVREWLLFVRRWVDPTYVFLACGTWSDPDMWPKDLPPVIWTGLKRTHAYDVRTWCYSIAAEVSAMYQAILTTDADVIANICSDALVISPMRPEMERLLGSGKLILAPRWQSSIEDAFSFYTRDGVNTYLNRRMRANLVEPGREAMLIEEEKTAILGSSWLNPWPELVSIRQEWGTKPQDPTDEQVRTGNWPAVIRPSANLRREILSSFKG